MNIILTYDLRWKYTPEGQLPLWASLDSVDYMTGLLEETGNDVILIKVDYNFERKLNSLREKYPEALVFWLNEFSPTVSGKDSFTVKVMEKVGMMHTGPCSDALATGLDKEASKNIIKKFGLSTPSYFIVHENEFLPINDHWNLSDFVMIKPLCQGNSRGINELSVVSSDDLEQIQEKVEEIHLEFGEPALVESYIGGESVKEFTVPLFVFHDGRTVELPIVEFDLNCIPLTQEKFKYLTFDIKYNGHFQKIPVDLPPETINRIYDDSSKIVTKIGFRDFSRVDIRMDSTGIYYLEVNVFPDKSQFNNSLTMSAYSLGLAYPELVAIIPYQAMLKYGMKPPEKLEELTKSVMEIFESSLAIEPAEVY